MNEKVRYRERWWRQAADADAGRGRAGGKSGNGETAKQPTDRDRTHSHTAGPTNAEQAQAGRQAGRVPLTLLQTFQRRLPFNS